MNLDTPCMWLTGASSGIGEALAARLAGAGANLAISSRRTDRLSDVAARVRHSGRTLEVVPVAMSATVTRSPSPGASHGS